MSKANLRAAFREKRRHISQKRREEVSDSLAGQFYRSLSIYKNILSFASKGCEIDLWPLNKKLCKEKRLLLPRLEGDEIKGYHVEDVSALVLSSWHVKEPDPETMEVATLTENDCVLVPGLAYDSIGHRIGYGLGYYDRFLTTCPAYTIGVAFREQQAVSELPTETHDKTVDRIVFF